MRQKQHFPFRALNSQPIFDELEKTQPVRHLEPRSTRLLRVSQSCGGSVVTELADGLRTGSYAAQHFVSS